MVDDLLPSKRQMKVPPSDPRPFRQKKKKKAIKLKGIHGKTEKKKILQKKKKI